MTEPTDALLPCPFCGEAAKHSFNSLYGDMSMASCKSCGATAYAPKWNRRAVLAKWGQPDQAAEPVARLVIGKTKGGVSLTHMVVPAAFQLQEGMYALYTAPQPVAREPLTDEQTKTLMQAHRTAMLMTCKARVPECGEFSAIAQDLDWLCESFGIKGGQHGTE